MEAEDGIRGHTESISRDHSQRQRAGAKAWAINHHSLPGLADLPELVEIRPDVPTEISLNAILGRRGRDSLTPARQRQWRTESV
jgi:hypothetical protein